METDSAPQEPSTTNDDPDATKPTEEAAALRAVRGALASVPEPTVDRLVEIYCAEPVSERSASTVAATLRTLTAASPDPWLELVLGAAGRALCGAAARDAQAGLDALSRADAADLAATALTGDAALAAVARRVVRAAKLVHDVLERFLAREDPPPPAALRERCRLAGAAALEEVQGALGPLWVHLSAAASRVEETLRLASTAGARDGGRLLPRGALALRPFLEGFFVLADALAIVRKSGAAGAGSSKDTGNAVAARSAPSVAASGAFSLEDLLSGESAAASAGSPSASPAHSGASVTVLDRSGSVTSSGAGGSHYTVGGLRVGLCVRDGVV